MKKFQITFTLLVSFVIAFLSASDHLCACNVEVDRVMKKERLSEILTCLNNKIVQLEQEANQLEQEANQREQEANQREQEANQREQEANQLRQEINRLDSRKDLPIGTILPSILNPSQFNAQFDSLNSSNRRIWVLANGDDVSGSKYANIIAARIPDLRGMFLRGMNEGRNDGMEDPEANRRVGRSQPQSFQKHTHKVMNRYGGNTGKDWALEPGPNAKDGPHGRPSFPVGGDETRPNNIAVYYYIKIN